MKPKGVDTIFFGILIAFIILGGVMFTSASLGILAKNEAKFYGVLFNQFIFGLGAGLLALYLTLRIPYAFWKKYSLILVIGSMILTAMVFVPHLGFMHGGARRWISIFGVSLQPVEFLKIGFIIYMAAWLSWVKTGSRDLRTAVIPLILVFGMSAGILLKQPDTKSLILIASISMAMLFVSGIQWKYIIGIFIVSVGAFIVLATFTPYLHSRIETFLHPSHDQSGASYQLQQSLISIGSGGIFGRGLGQSIQKFNYLPEPQGDSIFAVIGEELGFIGCVILICLFVAFTLRGYRIAHHAPDAFGKLVVVGLITLVTAQSFMNIASIIGVFPLTGVPLVFISQGGSSLLVALASMGIVLNISRYKRKAPELSK